MQRDPPPFVWAVPDEKNILNCEYPSIITLSIFPHSSSLQGISSLYVSGQRLCGAVVDNTNSEGLRTASMQAGNITA